jgi:hypothetical protein
MMKTRICSIPAITLITLGILISGSCKKPEWDEYYGYDERVDRHIWDVVKSEPRFSIFVEAMEEYKMDTLFDKDLSYTLFIPDNDAFEPVYDTSDYIEQLLSYHISGTVFLTRNVAGKRKLENLTGKYPVVEHSAEGYSYDMIPIEYSSPLYLDGIFYEIAEVAVPRPNLYEFAERFSPVIKSFIDRTDSVYLDKPLSTPIGFDGQGNTIYDSVYGVVNLFQRDYFPVNTEFRNKTATFILFTQEQYNTALDEMADILGPAFNNHEDIPDIWQFEVLLPAAMEKSLFDDELEYTQLQDTMVSVTGDTVYVDPGNIDPYSKYLCSNGLTYTYVDFTVPKDLYVGELRIEGEDLVDSIGAATYAWKPEAEVFGYNVRPTREFSSDASEKYIANVTFPRNYEGEWGIVLTMKNVFPMKYRLAWRAGYRPSGNYVVSVNDQVLTYKDKFGRDMEEFDTYLLRSSVVSVTGERFLPVGNFNIRDYWVENITLFGDVKIKFEYKGTGSQQSNGFNLDYVVLIPAEEK